MELLLVRHGEAKPGAEDPERSLTDRGVKTVGRVAARVAATGVRVHQIRHSGKRRAEQTAAIFGECLNPEGGMVAVPGLSPNDDVSVWGQDLAHEERNIMLVGHLPFLARLAGLLVAGRAELGVVDFDASSAVCLSRRPEGWLIKWIISPATA